MLSGILIADMNLSMSSQNLVRETAKTEIAEFRSCLPLATCYIGKLLRLSRFESQASTWFYASQIVACASITASIAHDNQRGHRTLWFRV